MKIAICQTNPVIGDFERNVSLVKQAALKAKSEGCLLAIFPEMCISGYPPKDLLEKPAFINENLAQLARLSHEIQGISLLCGYVDRNTGKGKPLINGAALILNGSIEAKGGKKLLPSYDVYDETRYFEVSKESLTFELGQKKWGVTICEDIWNAQDLMGKYPYTIDPVPEVAASGIDILVNISASPYNLGKEYMRLNILKDIATKYKISTVYCNQVGGNDDLLFDGSSMVVDPSGKLIHFAAQFEPDILIWDTDEDYQEIMSPWLTTEETLLKGLSMGTRDYASKCGFKKTLVGLSGGIDSALVAFIASKALGPENVMGVSMPSPYTSDISREDARRLSLNLGIRFEEIPISSLFQEYKNALSSLFKGLKEDETEENIQARIRGNLLMALSNKFKALLLSTGNKSELAVGYCTLYGDLSGGLAVISDIPKTLCYRLANYVNREEEVIPNRIISRPPSAELRPGQTDQDTLPPYEILDDILIAAVERNLGLDEIVKMGHDPVVVEDVLRQLAFNEYKRRQAPPGLRITGRAFGQGWRFPIARGRKIY